MIERRETRLGVCLSGGSNANAGFLLMISPNAVDNRNVSAFLHRFYARPADHV